MYSFNLSIFIDFLSTKATLQIYIYQLGCSCLDLLSSDFFFSYSLGGSLMPLDGLFSFWASSTSSILGSSCIFQKSDTTNYKPIPMIKSIWEKKLITIIQMDMEDVADERPPLPLLLPLSWNHYIGFYYNLIIQFFMSYIPYPFKRQQFWLELPSHKIYFDGTQIISHLVLNHELSIQDEPLRMICHFRSNIPQPQINLKQHFKNNLKASTALRYGKYGAAILTVEMSINNVEDMYTNFHQNQHQKFLGSSDFESDNLGYKFLIHRGQSIPIRIINKDFRMERVSHKKEPIQQFLQNLFGEEKGEIKLHGISIVNHGGKMQDLQKYCHPDGFLYFHI